MSRPARLVLGGVVALVVTAGVVVLSLAPYPTKRGDEALLRVSWSGRPERIERCREVGEAELAARPAHMRQRLECAGRPARYTVRVRTNGRVASLDTVTGGGLRGDRAIHMLREYRLTPGEHAIAVEVARLDTVEAPPEGDGTGEPEDEAPPGAAPVDRGRRERDERQRQRQEALPARLEVDTTLALPRGGVVLITYDPSGRRLLAMTASRP